MDQPGRDDGREDDRDDGPDIDTKPFKRLDRAEYDRVNDFIRDRTYLTAREWAVLRAGQFYQTETGLEMTALGEALPEIAGFIEEPFSPQNVNNARQRAHEKTVRAGATFLYAAMSGGFTDDEVDEIMYDATEIAKYMLEIEGADVSVDDEIRAEEDVADRLRAIRRASRELRDGE